MTDQEQLENTQNAEALPEIRYAGAWRRLAAGLIDLILFLAVDAAFGVIMGLAGVHWLSLLGVLLLLLRLLAYMLYFPIMESSGLSATVGKLALGIRVANGDGDPVTFPRALGRNLIKMLFFVLLPFSIFLLGAFAFGTSRQVFTVILLLFSVFLLAGLLMIALTRKKQCLHDFAAHTIVTRG